MGFRPFKICSIGVVLGLLLTLPAFAATKPTFGGTRELDTSHALAQGLVGCWIFNENSGTTANDSSGNNHYGIITGAQWLSGPRYGSILSFDASGDYMDVNGNVWTQSGSLLIRVKIDTSADGQTLLQETAAGYVDCVISTSTDDLNIQFYDTAFRLVVVDWDTILQATWVDMLITWDTTALTVYIDGTYYKSTPFAGLHANATGIVFCSDRNHVDEADCNISFAMQYNRALSPSEITSLYNDPFQMFPEPEEEEEGEARRATDSITDLPIKSATVTLYTASGMFYTGRPQPNPCQTDADGYYTLEADPGMYYI